ncbi:MAG: hypothetical protein LBL24_00815, partial [Bacteroidales bacterium]|nr:hypothetical protein [Bacteroidales bacterium]
TNPRLACYGKFSVILIPLNLKIEEKIIKAGQRQTNGRLKLRSIALEILISLFLHNSAKVNIFFTNSYNLYNP